MTCEHGVYDPRLCWRCPSYLYAQEKHQETNWCDCGCTIEARNKLIDLRKLAVLETTTDQQITSLLTEASHLVSTTLARHDAELPLPRAKHLTLRSPTVSVPCWSHWPLKCQFTTKANEAVRFLHAESKEASDELKAALASTGLKYRTVGGNPTIQRTIPAVVADEILLQDPSMSPSAGRPGTYSSSSSFSTLSAPAAMSSPKESLASSPQLDSV